MRLGLIGLGKIARDQHLPALAGQDSLNLVATADPASKLDTHPAYPSLTAMLAAEQLDAVSIATPPRRRHAIAAAAIDAGLHVMLEKPPAATLAEITDLAARANARGVTLFTSWHSREAGAVDAARDWLRARRIDAVRIVWKEDIRRWHPGQEWILGTSGFGVFDPAINALSIATDILPEALLLEAATFDIPEGRAMPLAATMTMRCGTAPATADLDFLQTGPQTWDMEVDTDAGTLRLSMGGAILQLPGGEPQTWPDREYARLYARFAALIAAGESDVDLRPFTLVADAFLIADRTTTAPFAF